MDAVIEYDKAAGFLKNPPSLEPCPNFTNIRALQKHIVQGLAQLSCPQSAINRWSGLAMDPAAYNLLEGTAFVISPDPGPTPVFPGGVAVARTVMKMTEATFVHDKNYFLSYKNITRACFRMLDANVSAQSKVSNNATLMGWNSTMSIINILDQLQISYGKPNMMTLFTNNTLFRSLMTPGDSPEMLFYRIEQCQEVQSIGKVPYSDKQIITNAICILMTSNIFPSRNLTCGRPTPPRRIHPSRHSFKKHTGVVLRQSSSAPRWGNMVTPTTPSTMHLKQQMTTPMTTPSTHPSWSCRQQPQQPPLAALWERPPVPSTQRLRQQSVNCRQINRRSCPKWP
jgi:hypothetical protein